MRPRFRSSQTTDPLRCGISKRGRPPWNLRVGLFEKTHSLEFAGRCRGDIVSTRFAGIECPGNREITGGSNAAQRVVAPGLPRGARRRKNGRGAGTRVSTVRYVINPDTSIPIPHQCCRPDPARRERDLLLGGRRNSSEPFSWSQPFKAAAAVPRGSESPCASLALLLRCELPQVRVPGLTSGCSSGQGLNSKRIEVTRP
jgi:hypothetical protein